MLSNVNIESFNDDKKLRYQFISLFKSSKQCSTKIQNIVIVILLITIQMKVPSPFLILFFLRGGEGRPKILLLEKCLKTRKNVF